MSPWPVFTEWRSLTSVDAPLLNRGFRGCRVAINMILAPWRLIDSGRVLRCYLLGMVDVTRPVKRSNRTSRYATVATMRRRLTMDPTSIS